MGSEERELVEDSLLLTATDTEYLYRESLHSQGGWNLITTPMVSQQAWRLQQPSIRPFEHCPRQLHPLVEPLPILCTYLSSSAPVRYWVIIVRFYACSLGIYPDLTLGATSDKLLGTRGYDTAHSRFGDVDKEVKRRFRFIYSHLVQWKKIATLKLDHWRCTTFGKPVFLGLDGLSVHPQLGKLRNDPRLRLFFLLFVFFPLQSETLHETFDPGFLLPVITGRVRFTSELLTWLFLSFRRIPFYLVNNKL